MHVKMYLYQNSAIVRAPCNGNMYIIQAPLLYAFSEGLVFVASFLQLDVKILC